MPWSPNRLAEGGPRRELGHSLRATAPKRLLAFVLLVSLALAPGCSWGRKLRARLRGTDATEAPTLRLVFVTDSKGYLEPCGCTSRQLGGIDRLAEQIAVLRRAKPPVLFVAAGDLFYAEPSSPDARAQQDRWKAEAVADAFRRMGLAALTPGAIDRAHDADGLASLQARTRAPWLATGADPTDGPDFTGGLVRTVAGVRVGLVGVSEDFLAAGSPDPVEAVRGEVQKVRADGATLVVVLVRGDRRLHGRLAAIDGVSFVVGGGIDHEAPNAPSEHGAYVLQGGRQGQRLVVVDLHVRDGGPFRDASEWSAEERRGELRREITSLETRIGEWERTGIAAADIAPQRARLEGLRSALAGVRAHPPRHGNWFSARAIELESSLPREPNVSSVLTAYDRRVNAHNRVALADVLPPPAVGPSFVGSASCGSCHEGAMRWWSGHPHGNAYATLERRHKEFNLDCVGCHVTGYDRPGGSNATHLLDGALRNVGCESCHGPGSEHVRNPTQPSGVVRVVPSATCVSCHNEEHSDHFEYETFRRRILVPGHGLPEPSR